MYPAFLSMAVGLLILSQAQSGVALLLAAACIGFGYGNASTFAQAIAVKESPPHRVGLATSTFYNAMNAALGIGPYLHGLIIPFSGYRGLYVILAVAMLICAFVYFVVHGKRARYSSGIDHMSKGAG